MVYVIHLDLITQEAVAVYQSMAMARAMGADITLPSLHEMITDARESLAETLETEPKRYTADELAIRVALGLKG